MLPGPAELGRMHSALLFMDCSGVHSDKGKRWRGIKEFELTGLFEEHLNQAPAFPYLGGEPPWGMIHVLCDQMLGSQPAVGSRST